MEIFPYNYYKLTESSNSNETKKSKNGNEIQKNISNYERKKAIKETSSFIFNNIINDISKITINSYKLRIYKKFVFNGSLNSASIVYNIITKELRFMIKGSPEEIINKCDKDTIPSNFEKVISYNRQRGLIILVCATKKLEINEYNDTDILDYYMEDLTFLGFISFENKIKKDVEKSITEIKKLNDDFMIISGDNVYNCLSAGFLSGIIKNKNIFTLDVENNNKISIRKIYSCKVNEKKEKGSENILKNSGDYSFAKIANRDNQKIFLDNNEEINKKYDFKKSFKDNNFNQNNEIYIPELQEIQNSQNYNNEFKKKLKKKVTDKRNKITDELFYGNSENERIIRIKTLVSNNPEDILNQYKERKRSINPNITTKERNNRNEHMIEEEFNTKYLKFMEKYYYQEIFKKYGDVKNGIFCMSGKLFNYLNNNKNNKGAQNFMNKVLQKTKIFFNMSSIDKTILVDYLRESQNNTVCVIGQCDSDIDSILSSDVGINLKKPTNMNTILSHFYSSKNNIICIKDIIITGKVLFENNILLESISFLCSMILSGYILCCLFRTVSISIGELNFLEFEYFILTTLSFLGKTKTGDIYFNQSSKVLNCYYFLQLFENIIFKVIAIIWFFSAFKGDDVLDNHLVNLDFVSYFFVLSFEFLICGILNLNLSSFNTESGCSNKYLIFFINIYLIYMIILVCLNSSNYSNDIFSITNFVSNEKIMDSFADNDKLYLLLALIIDVFFTFLFNRITYLIFHKFLK